jgi:CRP/FNR family transcriptional regulator, cyclic AMP receptor protein
MAYEVKSAELIRSEQEFQIMRKAFYLMGILEDVDLDWISRNGSIRLVPEGSILVREGAPIHDIFVVLDGKLSVLAQAIGNREIAPLYAGEVVGEISFVDSRPPSASVVAAQNSQVLAIPRATLQAKLSSDSGFSSRFYRAIATLLADRLRKTVSHLGYGKHKETLDADELDDVLMESASIGARRFDLLLKQLMIH